MKHGRFGFGRSEDEKPSPPPPAEPERRPDGERDEPARAMWTESRGDVTVAIPVRDEKLDLRHASDPARAAWIRIMAEKRELSEEQAAHLWDANIPLIPKPAFSEGFHARDAELQQREQHIAAADQELQETSDRLRAVEREIADLSERSRRLEAEVEKTRAISRAIAALAAATAEDETATDPDKMTQIAFSVLTDVSLALSGETERRYPSRPIYIRAAAVFKKLYDQGETEEFVTLYQDLGSLLREMEPYLYAAQQASLEGDRADEQDESQAEAAKAEI